MAELSKCFLNSEVCELQRSQVHPAPYNPREIDDEGRRNLKRSIKAYGIVGGIVINRRTGYTVVGGHQKIAVMDELQKYDPATHENDYALRAEVVDVDERTEKSLNVALNNPNNGGSWDFDKLRELLPDIDYKSAGLSDADLQMIGVDYMLATEGENDISGQLSDLMAEADQAHAQEVEQRRVEREAQRAMEQAAGQAAGQTVAEGALQPYPSPEDERQAKIDHMRDVKAQVREQAAQTAANMDAYLVLSFTSWEAKEEFCRHYGLNPMEKFIKGEVFSDMIEG